MAHVGGRQGQAAQHLDAARAIAGFFLQFAVGGLLRRLAGIDPALDQAELVAVHARRVLADQQHGLVVQHRHHHHRAVATADHALEAAVLAVGELQVQPFQPVRTGVLGSGAVDDGKATAHRVLPRRGRGAADIMAGCTDVLMSREC